MPSVLLGIPWPALRGPLRNHFWKKRRPQPYFWEEKAHKHKLFALVNVQMALGQTAGCPRVNRAKKFMCSPRNTGNIDFSLWLTGGLSQGCPDFQKVYVFNVYVPFSCPSIGVEGILEMLWKPQMLWIVGFGGSQPYSRWEFQETLWERFRGLPGIFPEFLPESPSRTGAHWRQNYCIPLFSFGGIIFGNC